MIFATNIDHITFHGGAKPIKQDVGRYISENAIRKCCKKYNLT